MAKIHYSVENLKINLLGNDDLIDLEKFFCGEQELDDFFHHEMVECVRHKYLAAYSLRLGDELVGLFTLMNDALLIIGNTDKEDFLEDLKWEAGESDVDFFSMQSSFPVINIGHLGISKNWQGNDLGTIVVEYVAYTFSNYHNAGCQFLTVDAIKKSNVLNFYHKNKFFCQTVRDTADKTRRMYRIL